MWANFESEPWFRIHVAVGELHTVIESHATRINDLQLPSLERFALMPQWFSNAKKHLQGDWDAGDCTRPMPPRKV